MQHESVQFTLQCQMSAGLTPGKLIVEAGGRLVREISAFVPIALRDRQEAPAVFEGRLPCVIDDGEQGFALLVGDMEVVRLDGQRGTVDSVCRLNRRHTDDRGFYTMRLAVLSDSALVIYEGGAMRVNRAGRVIWHTCLAWDDILDGSDEKKLYYSTEFGEFAPAGFTVDIETGSRMPR